jgi:hypothetical protein
VSLSLSAAGAHTGSHTHAHLHASGPSFVVGPAICRPLVYFKCGSSLHFGASATPCGHTSRVKVGLCNRGYRDLHVSVSPPELPFVLLPAHTLVTLRARSYVNLPIRLSPLTVGVHEGALVVTIVDRVDCDSGHDNGADENSHSHISRATSKGENDNDSNRSGLDTTQTQLSLCSNSRSWRENHPHIK